MWPPAPVPEPHFVAVLDLLGYRAHLWDDLGVRRPNGLAQLYETYVLLLLARADATRLSWVELASDGQPVQINEAVSCIVASDTLVLWAAKDKARFFVVTLARLVMKAIQFSAPLRGTLAFGDCILKPSDSILIGYPLVEAAEAEKAQEWVGVGVLPTAVANLQGVPGIVPYAVPVKSDSKCTLDHAVAWHWTEDVPGAATIYLNRVSPMAPQTARLKYSNALEFVRAIPLNGAA